MSGLFDKAEIVANEKIANFDATLKSVNEKSTVISSSHKETYATSSIFTGYLKSHCELIHQYTEASMEQVELMALALYGFTLSYANVSGVSLYAFDLSDTATGKSHNERIQRDAICAPINEIQGGKQQEAVDFWKSSDKKERDSTPPKLINIHPSKTYQHSPLQNDSCKSF